MHFIRSIAIFATILILPSVVFGTTTTEIPTTTTPVKADSPVKTEVEAINGLVTKKEADLVALLCDDAVWKANFAKLHTKDLAGTKELVTEVNKILTPTAEDTATIQLAKDAKISTELKAALDTLTQPDVLATDASATAFNPIDYVKQVHAVLVQFDKDAKADAETNKVFKKKLSVDDLAGPLAGAFLKLNKDKFTTDDEKAFITKLHKSAKGGAAGDWEMWQIALIILAIAAVVIAIAVAVYFLVVKRKN